MRLTSATTPKVAIISQTMAQRVFANKSPLGQRFSISGPAAEHQIEVVGVVGDVKSAKLSEEIRPMAYYPHAQSPQPLGNLVVRMKGNPENVIANVRQAIKQVNRNLPSR